MAEISLQNLKKEFADGTVAVHELAMSVSDGEFVSLLGPSGCGKTTLLRMIAGLEHPTSGEIRFDGRRVDELAPGKRNVAMVFQNYALYPHLSVRDNLVYPLRKRGVPKSERQVRTSEIAKLLHLEELLERRPRQLSGGQQQRVALGRAIIREPAVFLLDEPLSNLDAQLRVEMRTELVRLHQTIKKTMIYVTHDQLEAMTMSDRIAVMQRGRLQQIATPEEIYKRPANRFVASFVGTPRMNFFEAQLEQRDGSDFIRSASLEIEFPHGSLAQLSSKSKLVDAGVRPENIGIAPGTPNARVSLVEMTGHEILVLLETGDGELITRAPPTSELRVGDLVRIAVDPQDLHLFDRDTSERLEGWR